MNTLCCTPWSTHVQLFLCLQRMNIDRITTFCTSATFVLAAALYCSKTLGTRMILTVEWEILFSMGEWEILFPMGE